MNLDYALQLLSAYGYLLLFPLAVFEGPIVTVIAGLLVTAGVLNPVIVYFVVVAGDIVGDSFWYAVGRFGGGGFTRMVEKIFGVKKENIEKAKDRMEKNRFKMTMLSKLIHGIGFAGLIAAGAVRVSYPLFVLACLVVTLGQVAVFLALGLLFGHAYAQIGQYLDYFAATMVVVVLLGITFFIWWRRKNKKK
jgi:membrane protein DedA with SNARE-associated domain